MGSCCGKDDEGGEQRKSGYNNDRLSDPTYEGEKTDEKYKEGPVEDRHCTDILCCILFIGFCVGMVYIAMDGLSNGKTKYLGAVYDGDGKFPPIQKLTFFTVGKACKLEEGYEDYKYIYFWFAMPGYLNKTTCVKECPQFNTTNDSSKLDAEIIQYYETPNLLGGKATAPKKTIDCKPTSMIKDCWGKSPNFMSLEGVKKGSDIFSTIQMVYPTNPSNSNNPFSIDLWSNFSFS